MGSTKQEDVVPSSEQPVGRPLPSLQDRPQQKRLPRQHVHSTLPHNALHVLLHIGSSSLIIGAELSHAMEIGSGVPQGHHGEDIEGEEARPQCVVGVVVLRG